MIDYHRELLADERRTNAFREAILRVVKPGDVVLDLGCGSGILSFFACQAGAARVYAIDQTHAADVASLLARHNGLGDRITVLHGEAKALELPERADVLLSETLGVAGLDEGIVEIVADARTRFLKPDARIVPQRVGVSIVPVEMDYEYDKHVAFWNERRYGVDLRPLRLFASSAILFAHIRSGSYLATPHEVLSIDLLRGEGKDAAGSATFTAKRDAHLHGFGAFFSATLADGIELSNGEAHSTSWSQAFLPLEVPVQVRRGDRVTVELQTDAGKSWRWRGDANGEEFDQTTWLSMPPCEART
ncbi:MAG TPA: 50S ribosomal protein L11 methyltransferase [Thermoanaerobaculia bacterium]